MKQKQLIHTLPVRLRKDDKDRLETLADSWGVSLAEATRMAIESEHSRFQDERQDSRFEMILSDQQKTLISISESKARLEHLFSFFGEFERRIYERIDNKFDEIEPIVTATSVRLVAMIRTLQRRSEVEAEIQNILQGN